MKTNCGQIELNLIFRQIDHAVILLTSFTNLYCLQVLDRTSRS